MKLSAWKKWLAGPEVGVESPARWRLLWPVRFHFLAAREFHQGLCLERGATLAFGQL